MKKTKTIIITGTHHTPAIELINLLRRDKSITWNIYYLAHQYSTETHLIHTIIPKLKVNFHNLDCGKFDRKNLDVTLLGIPKTIKAFLTSLKLISQVKPNLVVSFGGYVSVPVILAAFFKKIPSITHEQTLTNSLSTRINSRFVTKIALSFDNKNQIKELPRSKVVITGNLIRQEIFSQNSTKFSKIKLPLIYITGGNQGSKFLNSLIYQLVPKLTSTFSLIHQTGKNNSLTTENKLKKVFTNYCPTEFVEKEDIGFVLDKASLVISRSGANICQELDILDKKSILIPLPFTQQDEQPKNALWLKSFHPQSTIVINQNQASYQKLVEAISLLSKVPHQPHPKKLPSIHPLTLLINEIIN